jgi:undecaprenyl-diphosphatase
VVRKLRFFIFALVISLSLTGSYAIYMVKTGNFHEITQGEAYRSAQLQRSELGHYIKKYGIRSILNLRGRNPDEQWYIDEIAVSTEHKVAHWDIALSSSREPTEEDVSKILEVFKTAPRPILIHCRAGADRSGLVAAMWKVYIDKESKVNAGKQLTIWYGHIPIWTYPMDSFFKKWNFTN